MSRENPSSAPEGGSGCAYPDPVSASTTEQPTTGVAVPVAVGAVIAAVVVVLAMVGLVVSLTTDRLPTGPALAPPPPPAPEVSYDAMLRAARLAELSVTMPGAPYECPSSPGAAPPILDSGLVCNAPVHKAYNGTDTWSATVGFGIPASNLTRPTTRDTATEVFQQLRTAAFSGRATTVSDYAIEQVTLNGKTASVARGNVHYTVAGLPSTYDRMVVVALPLDDDEYAIYFTSRPDDTPKSTLDKLNYSLGTIRYVG